MQHREVRRADPQPATEPLERLHVDLMGPFVDVASPRGARYAMVLFDEYSRFMPVITLRHKADARARPKSHPRATQVA
jgi:hypothetical protein